MRIREDETRFTLQPDEARCLFQVSARINAGLNLESILDGVFEEFRPLLPFDRMEYTEVEEGGRRLRTAWVRALYQPVLLNVGNTVVPTGPIPELAPDNPPPFVQNDVEAYASERPAGHPAHLLAAEGIRAVMNCPMVVDGRTVGLLFFASRSESYRPRHIQLFRYVASHLAGALAQTRMREAIEQRNTELELLHRQRGVFVAAVSHELRNPLTSVVGLSATLRDSLDSLERDEVRSLATILARESNEVAGIVDDLLAAARFETGHFEFHAEEVELRTEVDQVVQATRGDDRSIQVLGEPTRAQADAMRVRQILRNLLTNAFKYGGEKIAVVVGLDEGQPAVTVVDDGDGIPESERGRVFELYGTGTDEQGRRDSLGLGLAVSRQLATAMGGSLEYRYDQGSSRFVLRLPPAG